MKSIRQPFKPKAKLLLELGDQLIKDEGIALFELVKNSYDADATDVFVEMQDIDSTGKGQIIITDNGVGMSVDTVLNAWLEPGTDYRKKQLERGIRTKKFGRVPLGEKGIGRFGAHKLGKKIELVTRNQGRKEIVVEINWRDFERDTYLDDIKVVVTERDPILFRGKKTGTYIKISDLRIPWNRGMVRGVYRAVNSVCSPIKAPDAFNAKLVLTDVDKKDWLDNLFSWDKALEYRLFHASCIMDGSTLEYSYEFIPWDMMDKITIRKSKGKIKITDPDEKDSKIINLSLKKIGKVILDINIFDLESEVLSLDTGMDKSGLREFLKFNGGIRVYRDGIRVYDYGEPGNDWLELGTRRVNTPVERVSNNIVLGQVNIGRTESFDLIEKTNREGFIENEATKIFRKAIICAITHIETERNKDKIRLRTSYSKKKKREPVLDDLADLRKKLEKKNIISEYELDLKKIENDFRDIRDKLLTSAGAGLSLSIVIHEIQKIIKELQIVAAKEKGGKRVGYLIQSLATLTEGYAVLVRREGMINIKASELIRQSEFNVDYRLKSHGIELISKIDKKQDFKMRCTRRLIIGAVMNIVDNSIWWIENKQPKKKYIYISVSQELKEGSAIIIGDNGSGFMDDIEYMVQAFFTRKPYGMGLGLHITDEVMKVHGGQIKILQKGDVSLPKEIDGAVIALIFPKKHES